jgi:tetratricopeptide (TPR) repeat protein
MAYFRAKKRDAAIADFTKVIEQNPASAQAYARRGSVHGAKGMYDAAIADFSKAVELDPNDIDSLTYRGVSYYNDKKYAEAMVDFEKTMEIAPDNFRAAYGMARSHARLNQPEQACKWLAKSIENGFNNIDYIRQDPDLETIREAPCFKKIISTE